MLSRVYPSISFFENDLKPEWKIFLNATLGNGRGGSILAVLFLQPRITDSARIAQYNFLTANYEWVDQWQTYKKAAKGCSLQAKYKFHNSTSDPKMILETSSFIDL